MSKDTLPKINQVFSGVIMLIAGIFCSLFVLSLTLLPQTRETSVFFAWIYVAIFLIIWFELSIWWLKRSFEIESSKLEYNREKNIWSDVASYVVLYRKYTGVVRFVFSILLFLILFSFLFYSFFIFFLPKHLSFSIPSFILLIAWILYIILRNQIKSLLKKIISPLSKVRLSPTYSIDNDYLIIDLNIKKLKDPSRNIIRVGFEEIDELKTLSYAEGQTFKQYKVGPNIELVMKEIKDWKDYFYKNNIERPRVLCQFTFQSGGKTVFLKGKDLFYLVTFFNENMDDLINAYNSFKTNSGETIGEKE